MAIRYWLGVVSRDHVRRAVAEGFAQFNHGARDAVERLSESDGVVYYSPRASYPDGEPLRAFTAIGRVLPGEAYQVDGRDFRPWRRRIAWDRDAREAPVRPLRGALELTSRPDWGYALRRGMLELSRPDFELIRVEMHAGPHLEGVVVEPRDVTRAP